MGGIVNGKKLPGEEYQKYLDKMKQNDPNYEMPYERSIIQLQCLPLVSIIKALGNPVIDYFRWLSEHLID